MDFFVLVYLHEFLVNSCGSFISFLFNMYCVGMVGRDLDVWTSSKALFNLLTLLGGFWLCWSISMMSFLSILEVFSSLYCTICTV